MKIFKYYLLFFILLMLPLSFLKGQNQNIESYQFLSPLPGSKLNSSETNIIIRFGNPFDYSVLSNLIVEGNISGRYSGKLILVEENRTLIFYPDYKFEKGETVSVSLSENSKTIYAEKIPSLHFSFEISYSELNKPLTPETYLKRILPEAGYNKNNSYPLNMLNSIKADTLLPDDFPELIINTFNNPSKGYFFIAPFLGAVLVQSYLIILDNYGNPVYYKKITGEFAVDFKRQENGLLTYYHNDKFYVMDSSYAVIDSLSTKNGYPTDLHECLILNNGHTLLMSYDDQVIRMDTIVPGGQPDAVVTGLIIQELDENKNVVFQWRSWDHFKITDATYNIDLTASTIDYVHGNAIEMDTDGNILISSRHMDEITKINRQTGEIIWRLGGEYCENNQFTFLNDSIGFSHQHDIRKLADGNYLLFDNGNLHDPEFSRAVEYQLDEVNKTAMLTWEKRGTFSVAMGSSRRLENERTIIGWGWNSGSPSISEVSDDGTLNLQLSMGTNMVNYRAFKFPWQTNIFSVYPDTLSFINISPGDSLSASFMVKNNSSQEIIINGLYNRTSAYYSQSNLPVIIASGDSANFQVIFKPGSEGVYFDDLHVQWNRETERVARVITLRGSTDSTFTSAENENIISDYSLSQNYPNPFNPLTRFEIHILNSTFITLKIYDVLGNEIETLLNEVMNAGNYSISFNAATAGRRLSSGIYFYRLTTDKFT
ncbi:MAG: T9SS C-terminal target domain-containing protein, partial [Ignavibacteriales bacterium]